MKNRVFRICAVLMAVVMTMGLIACGSEKEAEANVGLANPIVECTHDEMVQATGMPIDAPEGAKDVSYTYINTDVKIAQVTFVYNGKEYCYRAKPTSEILNMGSSDDDSTLLGVMLNMEESIKQGEELSGLYEDWSGGGMATVSYCEAAYKMSKSKVGFITWFDVVPGILYSLSCDKCKSYEDLVDVAQIAFVPAQGDS